MFKLFFEKTTKNVLGYAQEVSPEIFVTIAVLIGPNLARWHLHAPLDPLLRLPTKTGQKNPNWACLPMFLCPEGVCGVPHRLPTLRGRLPWPKP